MTTTASVAGYGVRQGTGYRRLCAISQNLVLNTTISVKYNILILKEKVDSVLTRIEKAHAGARRGTNPRTPRTPRIRLFSNIICCIFTTADFPHPSAPPPAWKKVAERVGASAPHGSPSDDPH